MANTEVPGQGTFFKVLNPWIENAPQVSVIEDAEEWFVVGGNKEVRASQGEDTRMFQGPRECQCLTLCWVVITFCLVSKSGAGEYINFQPFLQQTGDFWVH